MGDTVTHLGNTGGSNNNNNNSNDNGSTGTWYGGIADVGQGLGSLASAWAAVESVKLAKDQFNFNRDLANRNILNQGRAINNGLANQLSTTQAMTKMGTSEEAKQAVIDQNTAAKAVTSPL